MKRNSKIPQWVRDWINPEDKTHAFKESFWDEKEHVKGSFTGAKQCDPDKYGWLKVDPECDIFIPKQKPKNNMNTEQKQKLNEICEANGFRIVSEEDDHVVVGLEVDIWEGVRFAECVDSNHFEDFTKGKIYRLRDGKSINDDYAFIDDDGVGNGYSQYSDNKKHFKPSTEGAYKAQLIKEAKDKFGNIKDGDRFKRDFIGGEVDLRTEFVIGDREYSRGWFYYPDTDRLCFHGHSIYFQGKWAERVEEERKVINWKHPENRLEFYLSDEIPIGFLKADKIINFINKTLNEKD